jgi:hypothetical protein
MFNKPTSGLLLVNEGYLICLKRQCDAPIKAHLHWQNVSGKKAAK